MTGVICNGEFFGSTQPKAGDFFYKTFELVQCDMQCDMNTNSDVNEWEQQTEQRKWPFVSHRVTEHEGLLHTR